MIARKINIILFVCLSFGVFVCLFVPTQEPIGPISLTF